MNAIHFFGGAGSVTGSCYLLELGTTKLLVDCGLFQGDRFMEEKNTVAFPFDPISLDAVFVTHAHADHIGRIPKLYREGFRGRIIATQPTCDLAKIMFADALKVMGYEKEESGADPIYTEEDIAGAVRLFEPHPYNEPIRINGAVEVTLRDSAHILGSAMIEVHFGAKTIVLTGDLGNPPTPLLGEPYLLQHTDYLVMESVYGDRDHENRADRKLILERLIENTYSAGGTILIPAFALERTQEMLADINELVENNRVPAMPVFVDSPLAIRATEVYMQNKDFFNPEAQRIMKTGDDLFAFPGLRFTPSREESKEINLVKGSKIIIAGNPHGDGSRIAYHFLRYLSDPNSTVLFVGFQRPGSMGRHIADGAPEVMIHGQCIAVNAHVEQLYSYSAHADHTQLKQFVAEIHKPIKKIFVAMGEPDVATHFAQEIRDEYGLDAIAPSFGDVVSLDN